jgi:hypothetical protein
MSPTEGCPFFRLSGDVSDLETTVHFDTLKMLDSVIRDILSQLLLAHLEEVKRYYTLLMN